MIKRISLLMLLGWPQFCLAKNITLVVDDVPVAQVLQSLADLEQKNLVIAPDVQGVVSLQLRNLPWKQAVQTVINSSGLLLSHENGVMYVHSPRWRAEKQAQALAEKEQRQQTRALSNRSIVLHHADASELAKAGEKLLSKRGTLTVDKRTNRLIVRDDDDHLPEFATWAKEMDLPVGQVEIAAHIVTINETSLRELGVKWNLAEASGTPGSGKFTTLSSNLAVADAATRTGFNIGRINGRLLELEQKQKVDIIASPRLLASHLQPASIKQGSEIPYQVSSGESGATSVEFKEAVLGMEVTPTVLQSNRIRLKLHISENMPGQVLQQADGEVLAIDKQEIETLVEVRSGETLALGGIFSQKNKNASDSVPFLGDIPLLGHLFRRDGKDNERRELVVFITPRIISAQ